MAFGHFPVVTSDIHVLLASRRILIVFTHVSRVMENESYLTGGLQKRPHSKD